MIMSEFEPDRDAVIPPYRLDICYDCSNIINIDRGTYLKSHPNIFRTRYRCKKCGLIHQKIHKSEFWEMWYIGKHSHSAQIIRFMEKKGYI